MTSTASLPDGLTERNPEWHFGRFTQFTVFKQHVGEPSPPLAMIAELCKGKPMLDLVWALGCWGSVYLLPMAQILWRSWSYEDVLARPQEFRRWLGDNWLKIPMKQERRCVRNPEKLFACLYGYAQWMDTDFSKLAGIQANGAREYYDACWNSITSVPYIGRYIAIRLLEGLRRHAGIPAALYDVRAEGGWSPKKCMVYLHPEHAAVLLSTDRQSDVLMDALTEELLQRMRAYIPTLDYYTISAMFCEYRVAFEKRRQYPACALDAEPIAAKAVQQQWGELFPTEEFYAARAVCFPQEALSEVNGWSSMRNDTLGKTLREMGYNWSDIKYNFRLTTDLTKPVLRETK